MNLAWLTDIHLNFIDKEQREDFYREILDTKCDGVLISGDIAEAPCIAKILQEMAEHLQKPIYFVLGNHDYYQGNISEVRSVMTELTLVNQYIFWLPEINAKNLAPNVWLLGQDGWADGRLGDYQNSNVSLNDSLLPEAHAE